MVNKQIVVRFFKIKIMALAGIKYMKDADGRHRYVRIDLDKYGKHSLLEYFLDGLEAEALKGEESISLDEFNRYIDNRLEKNVSS